MPRILIDACGWVAVIEAGINIDLELLKCCGYKDLAIVPNVISELESTERFEINDTNVRGKGGNV